MYISETQQRLINIISHTVFDRALGFVLLHGANRREMSDAYHIALWMEGAPAGVKREFLDTFDEAAEGGLRVCSTCGQWMTEGYYLAGDYACSDECAIRNYIETSTYHTIETEEEAREVFERDLRIDEEACLGEVYWTQW